MTKKQSKEATAIKGGGGSLVKVAVRHDGPPRAMVPAADAPTEYSADAQAALAAVTDDFDNVTRDDMSVPFMMILQALSPQCTPGSTDYNEDARPGMITHSITKELFKPQDGIWLTPVVYERSYLEWVPRDAGGGFRGEYKDADHEALYNKLIDRAIGKAKLPNGNLLVKTHNFYCVWHRPDNGQLEPVVVSMANTQSKIATNWMTMLQNRRNPHTGKAYPLVAAAWLLSTDIKKNEKGSWFVWSVKRAVPNEDMAIAQALGFRNSVKGNLVVLDRAATEAAHEDAASDAM